MQNAKLGMRNELAIAVKPHRWCGSFLCRAVEGASPYGYAVNDNQPVGDGTHDVPKTTAPVGSEAKPRVLNNSPVDC